MSMFENIREKVGTKARAAAKASGEFIEVSKLNISIKSHEDKIKEIKREMGDTVFSMYQAGKPVDTELSVKCDEILEITDKISKLKEEIAEIKDIKICGKCGTTIKKDGAFCPSCGEKIE